VAARAILVETANLVINLDYVCCSGCGGHSLESRREISMKNGRLYLLFLALFAVFAVCRSDIIAADTSPPASSSLGKWELVSREEWYSPLLGIDMASSDCGWSVGTGRQYGGCILQGSGDSWWRAKYLPETGLSGVSAVSPNEAWAVGEGGAILRWDGNDWTRVPSPTTAWLTAVDMVSSGTGIAVGNGVILKCSSGVWSTWDSVSVGLSDVDAEYGVAVGEYGTVLMLGTDEQWHAAPHPAAPTHWLHAVDMTSTTDGWIFGDSLHAPPLIWRWNGSSWSAVASPTQYEIYDVDMVSATDGWAVGSVTTILHWDGTTWTVFPTNPEDYYYYYDNLYAMSMLSASEGWACGEWGTILRYQAPIHSIVGRVVDSRDAGVPDVVVSASGIASATTDATGTYTITDLYAGTYTLQPRMEGYIFTPHTRTISVPPDATGQDFTARNIHKAVTPSDLHELKYGDPITYTVRLVSPVERNLVLYDRVPTYTTYISDSLDAPTGVIYDPEADAISGTLSLTATVPETVTFAVQVGVTGTIGLAPDITNRACIYPVGGELADCEWSNEVRSYTYVWRVYLPVALRTS
jgi:photosystem II stability/assembly factor-like uncharacterized protein